MHEKAVEAARVSFLTDEDGGLTAPLPAIHRAFAVFLRAVEPSEGMVEAIITEHIVIWRSPHENIKSGTIAGLRKLAAELEGE